MSLYHMAIQAFIWKERKKTLLLIVSLVETLFNVEKHIDSKKSEILWV